jgi:excisionase family DNA binding protein
VAVGDHVPITEAARLLGVSRTKVWTMIKEGKLSARPDPLDRRQRLIPRASIDLLLQERSAAVPFPRSVGIVFDPGFRSSEADQYMQAHREREEC